MRIPPANDGATRHKGGLLTRLRHDKRGNTLAMMAMATIPIAGMVGSAVDIGRGYLIKSRLQQACDAGVLATRRSMATTTMDAASRDKGQQFFRINFANDTAGSSDAAFTPSGTADGQVSGVATARVPMTITKVFGTDYVDLSVQCEARLDVANTDVMMVLDTTGSMAGSRIAALRLAVIDFHDTVTAATSADKRYRIGFVPYSSAVDMGNDSFTGNPLLLDTWLVDTNSYQSRVANMTLPVWVATVTTGNYTEETYPSSISNSDCTKYGANQNFGSYTADSRLTVTIDRSNQNNALAPAATLYQDATPATDVRRVYSRVTGTYSGNSTCKRRWAPTTTSFTQSGFVFRNWSYLPVDYDVSNFRRGTSVDVYTGGTPDRSVITTRSGSYNMVDLLNAPGINLPGTSTTWNGCVEERRGNPNATFSPIPANSWDLDVTTTPDGNRDTQWRPMWPEVVYDRNGANPTMNTTTGYGRPSSPCPSAASHLATRPRASVVSYVNALVATGSTYHDFGMAWGARMLSPVGMWAANNSTAPNGRAINRHLIFMTDGIMEPSPTVYGSQGYEESDRRVVGTSITPTGGAGGNMAPRHTNRFLAMCNAIRGTVTIWTINFSGTAQPSLTACADPGKAFTASNEAELRAQFQRIASQVAELRLAR